MERIVVLGPPGSGKSTVARALGARLGLPAFHLDQAFWRPGWVEAPPEAFRTEVERIAALPCWVIDGNYTGTLGCRLRRADLVVVLEVPSWLSLVRVVRRTVVGFGRVRVDAAPGCPERVDLGFLRFVRRWNGANRARTLGLLAGFDGEVVVVRGRRDLGRLLARGAKGPG